MENHVYKKITLVGSSPESSDAAIRNALKKASESVKNMRWFNVTETRGYIENGDVAYWQVTVDIGFTIED